ncbi:C4-dicarboxylate ABC transporter substrate-binding protein [Pseudooceanicola lipolyticus]|uniref:C4-dicarboxylate ABC transporter substrate-binding protein n=1 Tax=Pseudooceanicola lipolyticus TaxID=2029104 RepID=A0A2M8J606_9RHOB|nr:TAXI family TRAP transporter solute-binding subunit [Pseudooceanicola lipolyticus]PJE38175.1 C4-dicarboxylate ABC transporter substrate-binding protein [Pseudooceanicola lipolyticus]
MNLLKMAALGAAVALSGSIATAQEKFITIGTGGQTGVYYVVGQSICRLVNRGSDSHGLKCTAPSTGGSIANINAIAAGDMDMGVAQSDWQYHAYNGSSQFEGKQVEDLRAVFSVHGEPFTVVARTDSGIKSFDDLFGKRVNIGNPGSGQRATMEVVLNAVGKSIDDFSLASELKPAEQSAALGDNKVDAIIYTVGHPNGSIQEAASTIESHIVPVTGPAIDTLVSENPYYAKAVIPGGMYKGTDQDVETFGVKATFVTSANVPDEVVYEVVKAVFENFNRFKDLHPAFENLNEEDMISAGLSAPLHPGAEMYYKERGWIN